MRCKDVVCAFYFCFHEAQQTGFADFLSQVMLLLLYLLLHLHHLLLLLSLFLDRLFLCHGWHFSTPLQTDSPDADNASFVVLFFSVCLESTER